MSNYTDTRGNNLSNVFGAITGTNIGYDTGFQTKDGIDLRYMFLPLSQGENIGYNTGFIDSQGKDLREVFGKAIPTINLNISFQLQGRSAMSGPNTTQITLSDGTTTYYTRSITPTGNVWTTYTDTINNVKKIQLTLTFQNTNNNADRSNALYGVSLTNRSTGTQYITNGNFTSPTSFTETNFDWDYGWYYNTITTPDYGDLYYPVTYDSGTDTPLTNWSGRYVILGKNQVWGYKNSPAPTQFVSLQMSSSNNGIISQTFTPT